jgi:hypothetical protein
MLQVRASFLASNYLLARRFVHSRRCYRIRATRKRTSTGRRRSRLPPSKSSPTLLRTPSYALSFARSLLVDVFLQRQTRRVHSSQVRAEIVREEVKMLAKLHQSTHVKKKKNTIAHVFALCVRGCFGNKKRCGEEKNGSVRVERARASPGASESRGSRPLLIFFYPTPPLFRGLGVFCWSFVLQVYERTECIFYRFDPVCFWVEPRWRYLALCASSFEETHA